MAKRPSKKTLNTALDRIASLEAEAERLRRAIKEHRDGFRSDDELWMMLGSRASVVTVRNYDPERRLLEDPTIKNDADGSDPLTNPTCRICKFPLSEHDRKEDGIYCRDTGEPADIDLENG
jgi:hypothetical protein